MSLGLKRNLAKDYSAVDGRPMWDSVEFLEDGTPVYMKGKNTCIFMCIHGAGHSAMSFTMLAQEVQDFASTLSYDIRGHGFSKHQAGEDDLSIGTLVEDSYKVFEYAAKKYANSTFAIMGHSMGGTIAVRLAKKLETSEFSERVIALITVDVVEGTALEYLPFMVEVVTSRPSKFKSEEEAIKWAVNSKNVLNLESARISIPPQLKQAEKDGIKYFTWKNDLLHSKQYWLDWFKGLSSMFLASKYPKICFIAARERMDKELEIANMQGKFKLVTFPNVGHCMMEDDPVATAVNCHMVLDRFRCPLSLDDIKTIKEKGIHNFTTPLKAYKKK